MIWVDVLFAILIAVIVTALFYGVFQRAPWGSYWLLFFVILLGALAAGVWVEPVGAPLYGDFWLPGAVVALVFALLIAATLPSRNRDDSGAGTNVGKGETPDNYPDEPGYNPRDSKRTYREADSKSQATISGVFWLLLVFLLFIVMIGYFV